MVPPLFLSHTHTHARSSLCGEPVRGPCGQRPSLPLAGLLTSPWQPSPPLVCVHVGETRGAYDQRPCCSPSVPIQRVSVGWAQWVDSWRRSVCTCVGGWGAQAFPIGSDPCQLNVPGRGFGQERDSERCMMTLRRMNLCRSFTVKEVLSGCGVKQNV